MNTFLEDSLQADLELLKATEKANKATIAHFNLLVLPGLKKLPFRQGLGAYNLANRYPSKGIDISARLY